MIKLRNYQIEAIDKIEEFFTTNNSQYIEMPTGSGKTVTFLHLAQKNFKKVLIIVPSKQLQKQVYDTSLVFFNRQDVSRKGNRYDEEVSKIHICIINSIREKYFQYLCKKEFDLIIIDEAHHTQANSYKNFISKYKKNFPNVKILGVTATPDRLDLKSIKQIIGECSFKIKIEKLIKEKYLADIEGFCVKTNIDISDIHDHNSDFGTSELFKKLNIDSRNNLIISLVKDNMKNRKTLIFCINIEHSKLLNDLINKTGILCAHIDGYMKDDQRNSILNSFRNGEISCVCNCQLLTEGFDEPSIDGIILARPTKSRALFNQMIGRGLRIFPNKQNCKIIDLVDMNKNCMRFNDILEDFHKQNENIEKFSSINDIISFNEKLHLQNIEYELERTNFIDSSLYKNIESTPSMIEYLKNNKIQFFHPISFDDASFLIWYNELKKEFYNGNN